MKMLKNIVLLLIACLFIVACASKPPAPVVNRTPDTSNTKPSKPKPPIVQTTDGTTHIVQKGDTLYGIGLKYGYDYKEIAAANNILAPYNIQVGQTLVLPQRKAVDNNSGTVITPIKTETVEQAPPSKVTPVLSQPKVLREPYSLEAMTRKTKPVPPKPVVVATPEKPKTQPNLTTGTKPKTSAWQWPAQGKVISYFKEAANKGIDIAGKKGQAVHAAAKGKVIYKGSDLRGYGNLVIIKHSKTYLSVYAHNSKILVKEGQFIAAGQKIAEMGKSDTNSVKLHFEIRHKGKSVDPMKYLPQN